MAHEAGPDRRAVVVGSGPAGALAAIFLASQGWRVAVYERRKCDGRGPSGYEIVLGPRGLAAIRAAGSDLGPDRAVRLDGIILHHGPVGRITKVPIDGEYVLVNRDDLCDALRKDGADRFGPRLVHFFGHRLVGVDFEGRTATFEGPGGEARAPYDLLVGADGVWSAVRREMAAAGMLAFEQERKTGWNKALNFDGVSVADLPGADATWASHWHLWFRRWPSFGVSMSPTPDGRCRFGMGSRARGPSAGALGTQAALEAFFRSHYQDLGVALPEGWAEKVLDADEILHGGVTTTCSAFHGAGSVVLIGDAAHSVFPSAGEGCSLALEGCRELARALGNGDGDLAGALASFTATRKPQADACAAWSRREILSPWHVARHLALGALHRAMPAVFDEPATGKLRDPGVAYAAVERLYRRQSGQLAALVGGGLALAAAVALKFLAWIRDQC